MDSERGSEVDGLVFMPRSSYLLTRPFYEGLKAKRPISRAMLCYPNLGNLVPRPSSLVPIITPQKAPEEPPRKGATATDPKGLKASRPESEAAH